MNRIALYVAVLVLAVRDRWYMSKLNPWGAASGRPARPTAEVMAAIQASGEAFMRTARAGTPPPPTPED